MHLIGDEIERITGYPAEDFIENRRRTYMSLVHPRDQRRVEREVWVAVQEDRPYELEYRVRTAAGDYRWVLERGCAVRATSASGSTASSSTSPTAGGRGARARSAGRGGGRPRGRRVPAAHDARGRRRPAAHRARPPRRRAAGARLRADDSAQRTRLHDRDPAKRRGAPAAPPTATSSTPAGPARPRARHPSLSARRARPRRGARRGRRADTGPGARRRRARPRGSRPTSRPRSTSARRRHHERRQARQPDRGPRAHRRRNGAAFVQVPTTASAARRRAGQWSARSVRPARHARTGPVVCSTVRRVGHHDRRGGAGRRRDAAALTPRHTRAVRRQAAPAVSLGARPGLRPEVTVQRPASPVSGRLGARARARGLREHAAQDLARTGDFGISATTSTSRSCLYGATCTAHERHQPLRGR